jgi:hypothetical protein
MLTPNKNFQDRICVSCYVYKANGKKIINNLPKNYKSLEESMLIDNQGQDSVMVLTGKKNDLICFDVDDMEWFKEYKSLFEGIYCEESFSGKLHYYFKYTEKVPNSRNGFFDILGENSTALTGKPLNESAIMEMPEEIVYFIHEQLCGMENQDQDILELAKIMDYKYVKAKRDWLTVGQAFKYMDGSFFAWELLSMKDTEGYKKNFNNDGINCMDSIWDADFLSKSAFDLKFQDAKGRAKVLKKCPNTNNQIKETQMKEIFAFAKGFPMNHSIYNKEARHFLASGIAKLALKFEDDDVINWLVEHNFLHSSESKIPMKKMNHFDEDDLFYWKDFQKLLTKRGKEYLDGEILRIVCDNLHRVCAFYDTSVIIKKNETDMHSICALNKFPDFEVCAVDYKDPTISFLKWLKTTVWIIPEVCTKKLNCKFDFSYKDDETFYAACKFVAKAGAARTEKLDMLLAFIKEIICDNVEEIYEYVMVWMAMLWKFPHIKTEKALLLFGGEGIGKGSIVAFLTEHIFGIHNTLPNASYDDITGHKNKNLVGKKLICVNELACSQSNKIVNQEKIKTLITEPHFEMNAMCQDKVTVENSFDFIFMTNNESSLKLKDGDRRFLCITCSDSKKENTEYFSLLRETCFNPQCASEFVTHLESILESPKQFRLMKTPMTKLKQKMISSSEWDSSFYEALLGGEIETVQYDIKEIKKQEFALFSRQDLYNVYNNWMKENGFKPNNSARFKESLLKNIATEKTFKDRKYYAILNEKMTVLESGLEFDD